VVEIYFGERLEQVFFEVEDVAEDFVVVCGYVWPCHLTGEYVGVSS